MYYEDEFYQEFREEAAFCRYLEEVEGRAEWFRVPIRKLQVASAAEKADACTPVEGADMESLAKDTMKHSGLVIEAQGRVCQLGISAVKTLKGRARIDGKALAELDRKTLASILNECLKVAKGKALLRFCEGKVRAVLSGDEKDYSILSMPEVYMVASAYVHGDFEHADFLLGTADHSSVTAIWELDDQRMTGAYQELLTRYGKPGHTELKAAVRITTSDVGASGANIFYSLKGGGTTIVLGEALKVYHKNRKGLEEFTANMESIFDYYKEVLKGVMQLCDIWINHPANAMAGIMKQAGFGKKLTAETVESFRASAGEEPCSAYEVYCGICGAIAIARQEGSNERALLALEEKAAGCVGRRWHDYDIPGRVSY